MNIQSLAFFFSLLFIGGVQSHDSSSEEKPFRYRCANNFITYNLDCEPEHRGVVYGHYDTDKTAYVGLHEESFMLVPGRIQIDPPGIWQSTFAGVGKFSNDSSQTWFLEADENHLYEWVSSQNGDHVRFAIDIGSEVIGEKVYIGRVVRNGEALPGFCVTTSGFIHYVNEQGVMAYDKSYEVLTCKSRVCHEDPIPIPKPSSFGDPTLNADHGCINNWVPYENDDAPSRNGISAGLYDCDNEAYVGKGKISYMGPGRIQIVGKKGFYAPSKDGEEFLAEGSFYLADNTSYTYSWQVFTGEVPDNAVRVRREVGVRNLPVARLRVDGHMKIGGKLGEATISGFFAAQTESETIRDFEVLVCDPIPRFECAQVWKKYNNDEEPKTDGFAVSIYNTDTGDFIGRGTRKCINGCDWGLGRVQVSPPSAAGAYYVDDLSAHEVFDNETAEYLVRNAGDLYKWTASRDGERVENALEVRREGHKPFYIGATKFNYRVVVGKVRPGEGLFFAGPDGKVKVVSSYSVLTCHSPVFTPTQVSWEEGERSWFTKFGCPARKHWCFKQWRCVCKPEFRGLFGADTTAQWNEETCSYSI